jgi:hypothetical protein
MDVSVPARAEDVAERAPERGLDGLSDAALLALITGGHALQLLPGPQNRRAGGEA